MYKINTSSVRADFLENVVTQLVARRKELGLTQADIDHRLGISERLTSKWECGLRTPNSFNLYCWAQALEGSLCFVADEVKEK